MIDSSVPQMPLPVPLPGYAQRALRQSPFAQRLKKHFSRQDTIRIVSILDNNAENIPMLAPFLPEKQSWMFCNGDRAQTMLAVGRLAEWADRAAMDHGRVILEKGTRELAIALQQKPWETVNYPWDEEPHLWVLGGDAVKMTPKLLRMMAQRAHRAQAAVLVYDPWPMALDWGQDHHEDPAVFGAWADVYQRDVQMALSDDSYAVLREALSGYGYSLDEGQCSFMLSHDEAGAYSKLIQLIAEPLQSNDRIPYFLLQDWVGQKQSGQGVNAYYRCFLAFPAA